MSDSEALALAIEVLVERTVLRKLEEKLECVSAVPSGRIASPFVGVSDASKETGVPQETIRAMIKSGQLPRRLAGATPNPKRPTYLVSIDEVRAAVATGTVTMATSEHDPIDLQKHAARLRARAEKRGG